MKLPIQELSIVNVAIRPRDVTSKWEAIKAQLMEGALQNVRVNTQSWFTFR